MNAGLTLTPVACRFIARMLRASGMGPGAGFRLQVKAGGCSGYSADFSVEAVPLAGDSLVESGGVRLFLPHATLALLEGVTVDFSDTRMYSGFVFHSPNREAHCCHSGPMAPAVVSLDLLRRF